MQPPPLIPPVIPPPEPPSARAIPTGAAAAQAVLKLVGWPQDIVVLDWETYFTTEYSLFKMSNIEYIEDKKFEEQGVAVNIIQAGHPNTPRQATFWPDVPEELAWLQRKYGENLERCTVVWFNGRFDGTILVRKYSIIPPYVVDVRDLSRHLDARNRHHLKDCCERWNIPPKGDTMEFKGLRWATMTPEQRESYASYACNDAEREADLLCILLPKLTRPEIELPLQWHTHRIYWCPEFNFDFAEANRLARAMEEQVHVDAEFVIIPDGDGQSRFAIPKEISGNISFAKLMREALAETGEVLTMKPGKNKPIPALAKDDPAVQQYKRHKNPRVRELMKARQAVKSWPLHIRRVRAMGHQAQAAGGKLPNPLNYYGAHTGRWSGGEKINTANLPTRGKGLQTEIKHCLIAPPGYTLVMSDAAQIEARGDAWIAGQQDLLDSFARGEDVYSEFASGVLCVPVYKPRKDDPPPVAKLLTTRRAMGKTAILGLGYGMGATTFLDRLEADPLLRSKVESGEINLSFCKRTVDAYRTKYHKIPTFWRNIEDAFRYVTRYSLSRELRGLKLYHEGTTTVIRLPSGRCLFYPHASIGRDHQLAYNWGYLWGGTLTENIVQAMSRDVLAEALLYVERHGFRVGHHVYDSIVAVVPEAKVDEAKACVEEALTHVPTWAVGWPMGVETVVAGRYE